MPTKRLSRIFIYLLQPDGRRNSLHNGRGQNIATSAEVKGVLSKGIPIHSQKESLNSALGSNFPQDTLSWWRLKSNLSFFPKHDFSWCLCVFMSFLVIPDHFLIEFSGLYGVSPRWLDEQFNTLMYIQTLLENQEINLVTSWVRQIGLQVNESVIFSVQDVDILVVLQLPLFNPAKVDLWIQSHTVKALSIRIYHETQLDARNG